mmetsp:Transcript_18015/g.39298  ORF Transcript_18015/g.39298 Transcript_18015/m.39298 type:complete len:247 (+) Transcript_18015:24-764(+)
MIHSFILPSNHIACLMQYLPTYLLCFVSFRSDHRSRRANRMSILGWYVTRVANSRGACNRPPSSRISNLRKTEDSSTSASISARSRPGQTRTLDPKGRNPILWVGLMTRTVVFVILAFVGVLVFAFVFVGDDDDSVLLLVASVVGTNHRRGQNSLGGAFLGPLGRQRLFWTDHWVSTLDAYLVSCRNCVLAGMTTPLMFTSVRLSPFINGDGPFSRRTSYRRDLVRGNPWFNRSRSIAANAAASAS